MKNFDCHAAFIQDKMRGEDDIDDVLGKLKFEDALKEICHNQEKLLQNQTETKQSLTAIDELLNKRLQKRQEALQIAAFSSVSTRHSPRSSMTPVSMDSTPTIVSCTPTPVITPPSSRSISLPSSNRSNSHLHGVDKNPCFSLDDRNDLTSFNARNNEDTPIVSMPSYFATQVELTFCDFSAGPSSSSSSSVQMGGNMSSCSWGNLLIIVILPTCWMRGTPHLPPTMGQFPATWSISLLRIQQIAKVLYSNWWMACSTKGSWPVLVWLGVSEIIEKVHTLNRLCPQLEWKIYLRWPNVGFPLNLQGWKIPPNLEMPSTWNVAGLCSKISNPCFIRSCKKWCGVQI